jgi:hypothetical protein
MTNPDLHQLKDIHLPNMLSSWHLAPGWIVIIIGLACVLMYSGFTYLQQRRRKHPARYALAELRRLKALSENTQNPPESSVIASEISLLLRRTALHYFDRQQIAGLSGKAWLTFLNGVGQKQVFSDLAGDLLLTAPYQNNGCVSLAPLFSAAERWLQALLKSTHIRTN